MAAQPTIRLAPIVAIDVAGYSARTEANAERSARDVRSLRERAADVAARHGGRIFNTAGDGIMLEFTAAKEAIAAIGDLLDQRPDSEPEVRIGAHLGDVSVAENGDLLGHGVNVAARLMALSEPNRALVSQEIKTAAGGQLDRALRAVGELSLPKMDTRISAFEIVPHSDEADEAPSKLQRGSQLWRRVKDHKVLQWALGYLGAALALAHGSELMGATFEWPETVQWFILGLLIIGFPLVLTFAWYHGHKGLKRFSAAEMTIVSLLLLLVGGGFFLFVRAPEGHSQHSGGESTAESAHQEVAQSATSASSQEGTPPQDVSAKPRIAILPFSNLSPDPNNAFFTDGLHEQIISSLANSAPGLEVISRTTMMIYRTTPKPVSEIAKELGCSYVLEGSVRRDGDKVRLTLQLIDAHKDEHVWAQDYDRTLSNALTLQTEVAKQVAGELSVQIVGGEKASVPLTTDPVAYDLYLKARLARQALTGADGHEEWIEVVDLLSQAIQLDPKFALAYVERFSVCLFLMLQYADPDGRYAKLAKADLAVAQQLAPENSAVIGAMAAWAGFNQEFERSQELSRLAEEKGLSDFNTLFWIGYFGNFDATVARTSHLVTLDPGNTAIMVIWQAVLLADHRPRDAVRAINIASDNSPDDAFLQVMRAQGVFQYTGDLLVADEISRLSIEVWGRVSVQNQIIPLVYRSQFREAREMIDTSQAKYFRYAIDANTAIVGVPGIPVHVERGYLDLLLSDQAEAAKDGKALLAYVQAQRETPWNKWMLRRLTAQALLLGGQKDAAIKAGREALELVPNDGALARLPAADLAMAKIFAWAGAHDDAVDLLERLSSQSPGVGPAWLVRDPVLAVPLKDNARFQALKAKLEAQMAATTLE